MELLMRKPNKNVNDIMRISYYSPKKNVKTLSFANFKPVLIFTAEKNKESVKDRETIVGNYLKKKLTLDNINKPDSGDPDVNVTNNNNSNQNNIQNGGRNFSLQLNNNYLANSIEGKVENGSFFKKLGIDIMNTNIKLLSPSFKKENFIISNQNPSLKINDNKFNSSLNNKISSTKNINNDSNTVNGITNKSFLNENLKNASTLDKALMKLLDNGTTNKKREHNPSALSFANHNSVGNPNSEIIENKRNEEKSISRSISPNKRNSAIEENEANLFNVSIDDLIRHLSLFEILLEMEIAIENRQSIFILVKRLQNFFQEEILEKNLSFEILNYTNINKGYIKIIKICLLLFIFLKFILLDFNYDSSLKSNLKKILQTINEINLSILDYFIIPYFNNSGVVISSLSQGQILQIERFKDFIDKYIKISKNNKTKKNKKDLFNTLIKNCDIPIHAIRNFSNNYFKIGYFKSIHNIVFDLLKLIDVYSLQVLANLTFNNIVYATINNHFYKTAFNYDQYNLIDKDIMNNNGSTVVHVPFLPPQEKERMTLVLDLDETLVHFFYTPSGGTFIVRPGAMDFLKKLTQLYEIVIFTAATKEYADNILDTLDLDNKLIIHRLYRQHTSVCGLGDLSKIGRDGNKTIIIDNIPENFKLQPNNGLAIKTFIDDMKDTHLVDLLKILQDLHSMRVSDVKPFIRKVKEEYTKRVKKNPINPYANIEIYKL